MKSLYHDCHISHHLPTPTVFSAILIQPQQEQWSKPQIRNVGAPTRMTGPLSFFEPRFQPPKRLVLLYVTRFKRFRCCSKTGNLIEKIHFPARTRSYRSASPFINRSGYIHERPSNGPSGKCCSSFWLWTTRDIVPNKPPVRLHCLAAVQYIRLGAPQQQRL